MFEREEFFFLGYVETAIPRRTWEARKYANVDGQKRKKKAIAIEPEHADKATCSLSYQVHIQCNTCLYFFFPLGIKHQARALVPPETRNVVSQCS